MGLDWWRWGKVKYGDLSATAPRAFGRDDVSLGGAEVA